MKTTIRIGLLLCALVLAPIVVRADDSTRPVKLLVGTPAGGPIDFLARLVAEHASKRWGRSVVVENRTGAGGLIATQLVSRAEPDGQTLLVHNAAVAHFEVLNKEANFQASRDLTPLSLGMSSPYILFTGSSLAATDLRSFVNASRSVPKGINVAVQTGGGQPLISSKVMAALKIPHVDVPYNGSAPIVLALRANDVQAYVGTYFGMDSQVKSNAVRAVAQTGQEAFGPLPDLPTLRSLGVDVQIDNWYGFYAPPGMRKELAHKLAADLADIIRKPEVAAKIRELGFEPQTATPEEFARKIAQETQMIRELSLNAQTK